MTLLLVRHAETEMAGRFCGCSDPPLNERGREQVDRMIERLREEQIDAVYSSDLLRARQTAEAIAAPRGYLVRVLTGLREIGFGAWEGLTWRKIEELDKIYAERWVREFPKLPAPGGEDFDEFRGRVLREFAELRERAERRGEGTVAVVAHGGVLRLLLEEFGGCSSDEAWRRTRDYTGVIRCVQDGAAGAFTMTS